MVKVYCGEADVPEAGEIYAKLVCIYALMPMILPNKAVAIKDLERQLEAGAISYEEFQEQKSAIE